MQLYTFVLLLSFSICISSAILSIQHPNTNLVTQNFPENATINSNSDIQNTSQFSSLELNNTENSNISDPNPAENGNFSSSELNINIDNVNENGSTVSTNPPQMSVSTNTESSAVPELPSRIEELDNEISANSSIFIGPEETANTSILENSTSVNSTPIPTEQLDQPELANSSDIQTQPEEIRAPILGEISTNQNVSSAISTQNLGGNFTAQFTNLPPINLRIESGLISFSGCNINSFPFSAYENGSFLISGPGISTRRACLGEDNDSLYATEIESVNGYSQSNGNIILSKNGQISITLTPTSNVQTTLTPNSFSNNLPDQITTTSVDNVNTPEMSTEILFNNSSLNSNENTNFDNISGSYVMFISGVSVPPIAAEIGNNVIEFFGCNSISIRYSISPNGSFESIRPAIETLRFCSINNDGFYIDAILNADSYLNDETGIHLSKNGIRMLSFFNSDSLNATRTTFEKPTKLILTNSTLPAIDAFVSEQRIRLQGCNSIIINYESFSNGFFRLTGPIMITRNSCEVNNDESYIEAIRSANMYEENGDGIVLLDGSNVVVQISSPCA